MRDPNPRVSGKGIRKLRRARIRVVEGVLQREAQDLNKKFAKHIATALPYIHLKVAQTLDGKISGRDGERQWISSKPSRRLVHRWRAEYDAVLVGSGTVKADDPRLTVRMVKGRNPDVLILDGRLSVSPSSHLFGRARNRRVFLCVDAKIAARKKRKASLFERRGVDVLQFEGKRGRISLVNVLKELYRRGIGSVLVEGGRDIYTQFVEEGLVNEMSMFISPSIIGEGIPAFGMFKHSTSRPQIKKITAERVGTDILLKAFFR
jgi:diaminohydroxyphosphoribosylaminopyrimidine deaminase/5-amino-6-(5-phosphoribosylamino)uracil reductase